jgi:hypothetical protein
MKMRLLAAAALAATLIGGGAEAAPRGAPDVARPGIVRVVDRPEIRSYQPYSTLQFGFRPEPPRVLGNTPRRPRVIMPTPVAPLIEYGKTPNPYSAQWYVYCAERFRSFEPSTGFYTTYSGRRRLCR